MHHLITPPLHVSEHDNRVYLVDATGSIITEIQPIIMHKRWAVERRDVRHIANALCFSFNACSKAANAVGEGQPTGTSTASETSSAALSRK